MRFHVTTAPREGKERFKKYDFSLTGINGSCVDYISKDVTTTQSTGGVVDSLIAKIPRSNSTESVNRSCCHCCRGKCNCYEKHCFENCGGMARNHPDLQR